MAGVLTNSSALIKIAAFCLVSFSVFILFKHIPFSGPTAMTQQLQASIFTTNASDSNTATEETAAQFAAPPPPSAQRRDVVAVVVERTGIVDEMGAMTDDFIVGEFDETLIESVVVNGSYVKGDTESDEGRVIKFEKFRVCDANMSEYLPCLDNVEVISRFNSSHRGEKYERHCPENGKGLDCVVPRPKSYKLCIPWPKSRDEVWFDNVPHTHLVEDKEKENWISRKDDKLIFPGGGSQFKHGANQYLDQISKMVPEIAFGEKTRVALDVGCGVGSFGAYLMERNVTTLSIAPKDTYENQIQFILERGLPGMLAAFATRRLPYPSQAFDLIHCSKCKVNWTYDDGILLLEANRILRAGGFFIWAAEPVYKHEENLLEHWRAMEDLTSRLCWELVEKEGYIAIWQKPLNNSGYLNRGPSVQPAICDTDDDPDNVWYVNITACINRLPETGYGANISSWPARLHHPPDRLFSIKIDADISRRDLYRADSKYWHDIISGYVGAFHLKDMNPRNVMDMKAGYGGFAAALLDFQVDSWIMNVVPVSGPNTLPVIYDRGLIGVMHDWCEPFDTYPRTYDFMSASGLFSVEQKRCNISNIMLEMDRILRPGGKAYIRDTTAVIYQLEEIAKAMGWVTLMYDTGEGPHSNWKLLNCEKRL